MKKIKCDECGKIMAIIKSPIKHRDGTYSYGYHYPRYCPYCGNMRPNYKKHLEKIFEVYDLNKNLYHAKKLMMKSEYVSACRECFVVLENAIKKEAGIKELHGSELVSKAFSFKYDKLTLTVTQPPLISINSLSSESDINEQDGIMHMLMGFFRGPRNIYQHNNVRLGFNMCFSILIETSFFLDLIAEKHSLLSKPKWIKVKRNVTAEEIYNKMPRKRDRIAYLYDCTLRGIYKPFVKKKKH